jgi:hypothetical protein
MKALPLSLIVLLFGGPLAARQVGAAVAEKAALEGQVVKAATGEPLKKALLRLRKADARAQVATAVTDAGGRFAFSEIEPGRYRLSVQRNGYLQQRYGQRAPNHPGTILSLAPGQRLRDIVFRLIPYGVITGQVYDEDGEWILGASVQVLRYMYVGGERQLLRQRQRGNIAQAFGWSGPSQPGGRLCTYLLPRYQRPKPRLSHRTPWRGCTQQHRLRPPADPNGTSARAGSQLGGQPPRNRYKSFSAPPRFGFSWFWFSPGC